MIKSTQSLPQQGKMTYGYFVWGGKEYSILTDLGKIDYFLLLNDIIWRVFIMLIIIIDFNFILSSKTTVLRSVPPFRSGIVARSLLCLYLLKYRTDFDVQVV